MKLKIAITHGDINGVGYEVILKALEDARIFELCTPIVYGSAKIASHYRKALGIQPINMTQITDASQAHEGAVNIINVVGEDVMPEPGQSTEAAGRAALASLERAVADLNEGLVDALVTAPINKHNIQSPDFTFPGHTEYLEARAGDGAKSLMVLCSENLRVALATTHMAIKDVPGALSVDSIVEKLNIFNRSLHRDFGVDYPRIAVLALNPHAGEEGMLGTEENEIIAPAIAKAKEQGIAVFGPYAADGFFGAGRFVKFDGVLAMYHDQGLAPFKTMSMGNGINFTAGLPVVRTSPDHGTGYDIAGSGEASPESMLSSIYAAIDIVRARAREDEAHANPLRRMYRENESKGRKDRD
ncbi:MAG: 4-hydroxythreonine-4-phosphate dehydrogenase PdxA [Muribaculaceae bacterium]|nr:4-hydroxythreonine-4-phosphate dehydrogenase PdxA [Muribaculaceae bacterium]